MYIYICINKNYKKNLGLNILEVNLTSMSITFNELKILIQELTQHAFVYNILDMAINIETSIRIQNSKITKNTR